MSTEIVRPVRSISYNDIKKRRMLRESKSKSRLKLKNSQASTEIVQTEKKVYPRLRPDKYASERPNQFDQFANQPENKEARGLARLGKQISYVRDTVKRKISSNYVEKIQSKILVRMSGPTSTERVRANHEIDQKTEVCHSREIVRDLIQESKSQRKLIKYQDLRNKFKLSKSRSKSKSAKSLVDKSRILARKLTEIETTPQKPNDNALKGIKNSHRIKKFQSINEQQSGIKSSFRYLVSVPRQNNRQLFKGSKSKAEPLKSQEQVESSIEIQKQSSMFDSQDDKFLEQMHLKPQRSHEVNVQKRKSINCDENILDLLDVEHRELSRAIEKKQREKKILKDLQKLNKKFPKGFFKL